MTGKKPNTALSEASVMIISKLFNQKGIGLIEVLIALLVVSLGLLALASFQGSLLKASGSNKARAEAIGIAQQEIELIRYAATRSEDFRSVPSNASKPVKGTNADFTVTTAADDPLLANNIINVAVNVLWTDAAGDFDSVTLVSQVGLQDIQKSALSTNDSAAAVAVPSPRQSASEDVRPASENIDDPNVISPTETPLPARGTVTSDESRTSKLAETFSVNSTVDGTEFTLTAIAEDSRYYNTRFDDGVLGVYVCESTAANGCRYIQNHFGGVSLSTSGTIYSYKNNTLQQFTNIKPVWSSSEVTACYEGPITREVSGSDDLFSKPYECVYAGNCTDSSGSCQQGVTVAEVSENGVGPGGEFGNLGLIGLNGGDQVCFLEDTPDDISVNANNSASAPNILNGKYDAGGGGNTQNNEHYLFPSTTRAYVARRMLTNGNERSEGINKSFRNHNFLLVNRVQSPQVYQNCFNAVVPTTTVNNIIEYTTAPKNVVRVLGVNGINVVDATTTFSGTMPALTIRSTYSGLNPVLYINEIGACYLNRDPANNGYACVIPDSFANDGDIITLFGKTGSIDPDAEASPSSYNTCEVVIDRSQTFNISAGTPCVLGTNF